MINMTNFIPSEYFDIKHSKYSSLLDEIYKLTKVYEQDTEIEEGEIEVEEDEPTSHVGQEIEEESQHMLQIKMKENIHSGYGNISSFAEDLSFKPSGKDKTSEVLREKSHVLPPLFPPLHFPPLPSLPPHPTFYPGIPFPPLPLSFPGVLPPPWTHHPPPLFLPSVPPPPMMAGLAVKGQTKCPQPPQDVYLPPDEKEFKEARGFDLKILFELDTNPDRLSWIVAYMDFMAREGEPLSLCPSMYKEPLDLFKLYKAVGEEGGFRTCSANKAWKKISVKMTQNYRQSFLWRLLQKLYRKYLLKFEIFDKYDDKSANLEELCHLVT